MSTGAASFDWIRSNKLSRNYPRQDFASVRSLVHSPLREEFEKHIQVGHYVEYQQDCHYRTAKICRVAGYYLELQWIGPEETPDYLWVHIADANLHETGYFHGRKISLDPPSVIERLGGPQNPLRPSIPSELSQLIPNRLRSKFRVGMNLEAIDPRNVIKLKPVKIKKIIGKRLEVEYEYNADEKKLFWYHEASPLIYPVGFASLIGLNLDSGLEYEEESYRKAVHGEFSDDDASWRLFPPLPYDEEIIRLIRPGMDLEALDPSQPSKIFPATIIGIHLRGFLLIALHGSDRLKRFFCHVSYPYLFPAGFCEHHNIELSAPADHEGTFSWDEHFEQVSTEKVPDICFDREEIDHGIEVGQYLEAADSIEPNLICPAKVVEVKGHLIKIHFLGWKGKYDEWVDSQSSDIFPIGWCLLAGYKLTHPPRIGRPPKKLKDQ